MSQVLQGSCTVVLVDPSVGNPLGKERIHECEVEGECMPSGLSDKLSEVLLNKGEADIRAYPFDQVRYRLQKDGRVPAELIDTAIEEFRKFMVICLRSEKPIGMISPLVDEVWHAFILFTKDYADFTHAVFGKFLHHIPNTPFSVSSAGSGRNFVELYTKIFGDLHPIWSMRAFQASESCKYETNCDPEEQCSGTTNCQPDTNDCSSQG